MKIILSRKGFDSVSGGVPSPILPDGKLLSLPIPDKLSRVTYHDLTHGDERVGDLVEQLAGIPRTHRAHIDPDLSAGSLPRARGWRPIFGQVGAAERHLENQGVDAGDVFLFFGLFRQVERSASRWRYVRGSRAIHAFCGWLQVAERVGVSDWPTNGNAWALYHPHFSRSPEPTNVVYVSSRSLAIPKQRRLEVAGAGTFDHFSPQLRLTAPGSDRPSLWRLPEWFYPRNERSPLTYHRNLSRWRRCDRGVELSAVARGQEFVLDCDDYPQAAEWLASLLRVASF